MKRLLVIMLIAAFAVTAFSQTAIKQEKSVWRGGWVKDYYYLFERGETPSISETFFEDVKALDTLYTDRYYLYPYNYAYSTVADSNAAADSVKFKAELWVSRFTNTDKFSFEKTLLWDNQAGTVQNQAFIDGTGYWKSNFGDSEYKGFAYYYIRFIALTKHRIAKDGVKFEVHMTSHILNN